MRVVDNLVQALHRRGQNMVFLEKLQRFRQGRKLLQPMLDKFDKRESVFRADVIVGEARIVKQVRNVQHADKAFPLMRHYRHHYIAAIRLENPAWHDLVPMRPAALRIEFAVAENIALERSVVEMEQAFDQGKVDILSDAGLLPVIKRRQNRGQSVHAAALIGNIDAGVARGPVRISSQVGQPAHRLRYGVVAGPF